MIYHVWKWKKQKTKNSILYQEGSWVCDIGPHLWHHDVLITSVTHLVPNSKTLERKNYLMFTNKTFKSILC